MALYPTPTGHRMAFDRDGSGGAFFADSVVLTSMSTGQLQAVNDESDATTFQFGNGSDLHFWLAIVFPELRDVSGYYLNGFWSGLNAFTSCNIEWSTNTTTGQDGAWSSAAGVIDLSSDTSPAYRSSIQAFAQSGIAGIRCHPIIPGVGGGRFTCRTFQVYGQPAGGQNPDSLRIWQPVTNAEVTTVFDWGDIPRGTSATKTFRVENLSGAKTATSITVSAEALTDASPTLLGQYLFSTDNITFASSINIGNLAPGAVSAVLYVRNNVDAGAQLSVWGARMVATPASFV